MRMMAANRLADHRRDLIPIHRHNRLHQRPMLLSSSSQKRPLAEALFSRRRRLPPFH